MSSTDPGPPVVRSEERRRAPGAVPDVWDVIPHLCRNEVVTGYARVVSCLGPLSVAGATVFPVGSIWLANRSRWAAGIDVSKSW